MGVRDLKTSREKAKRTNGSFSSLEEVLRPTLPACKQTRLSEPMWLNQMRIDMKETVTESRKVKVKRKTWLCRAKRLLPVALPNLREKEEK